MTTSDTTGNGLVPVIDRLPDRVHGALLGGAIADALSDAEQQHLHFISSTTQTTLYVLDGLLEWIEWANQGDMADPGATVWLAGLRWWRSQYGTFPDGVPEPPLRWLDELSALQVRRRPDPESLQAYQDPHMGVPRMPRNPDLTSPVPLLRSVGYGLVPGLEPEMVVSLARQGAVLTHGAPESWTASAAWGLVISSALHSGSVDDAVDTVLRWSQQTPDAQALADIFSAVEHVDMPADSPAQAVFTAVELVRQHQHADAGTVLKSALNHEAASVVAPLVGQLWGVLHGAQSFSGISAELAEDHVISEAARRWVAAIT